jgi:hypothetical protein
MSGSIVSALLAAVGEERVAASEPQPTPAAPPEPEPDADTAAAALTAHPEYAYTRRQGAWSFAHTHAVLDQDLSTARFKRTQGDALCRPARSFWGLEPAQRPVSCPRCVELAGRYGVTLTDPTKEAR